VSAYKTLWIEAALETKERKKVMGEGTVTEPDRYQIDAQLLANKIEDACNAAEADGYDIISIMPVDRGREYMGSIAYSITDGVILTAKKRS